MLGLLWLDLAAAGGMVTGPERKGQCSLWGSSQQTGKHLPGLLGGFFLCLLHTHGGGKLNSTEYMIDLI